MIVISFTLPQPEQGRVPKKKKLCPRGLGLAANLMAHLPPGAVGVLGSTFLLWLWDFCAAIKFDAIGSAFEPT